MKEEFHKWRKLRVDLYLWDKRQLAKSSCLKSVPGQSLAQHVFILHLHSNTLVHDAVLDELL